MERRTFLIGAGSIATAAVGAAALSGSAAASVETGVFDVGDVDQDSHSGRLRSLELHDISVAVEWEGFNAPATEVTWTLFAEHPDAGEAEIGTAEADLGGDAYVGSADATIDSVDLIDVFGVEAFEAAPHPEGDDYADHTESWEIAFRLLAEVEQVDGDVFSDEATGNALTEVTNLETAVDTGGSADLAAEQETGDEYEPEPVEGGVDELEGVTFEWVPNPFSGTITNDNEYPVVVTVDWKLSGKEEYEVDASSTKEVDSPFVAQAESESVEEEPELVDVESA